MKDNFSNHAADYAQFRPTYPAELYSYLFSLITDKDFAWDCGTGNGQIAVELAKNFNHVWATDLSEEQLKQAPKRKNIDYEVHIAEKPINEKQKFDLITVAQAIHWFDFEEFYKSVKLCLKPNGIFAVIGYTVLHTEGALNEVIERFYKKITDPYWDPERNYLDDGYLTIPFPFKEEVVPKLEIKVNWEKQQFLNYLNTWSAVKHYEKANGHNPLTLIEDEVDLKWGNTEKRDFIFPLLVRVGRL